MNPFHRKR